MLASLTTTLTLIALAGATPVPQTAQQLSRAKAYQLQVQLRDPTKDLNPPISGQFLGGVHVGAGMNIATVGTPPNPMAEPPYYTNNNPAEGEISVLNDLGTVYPWGLIVQDPESFDYTYPGEHDADINVGGGSNGLTVVREGDSVTLGGLAPGNYAVCNRFIGYTRSNMTVVRYVYEGETLPTDCVAVNFLPLCAELQDLPDGSEWTHDYVQEVDCVVPPTNL
ncbi:hypothetical protein GGS26DRAFT_559724 [Hypomontagnella submonticulosa]|nr:hypothetical protein GGS26DRAFT_559724 [Hypomontagnella submonticulosa]